MKFDAFWKYFVKTWTQYYDVTSWNLFHMIGDPSARSQLLQRTNNCLERYNREMNEAYPVAHPNISMFVSVIKQKSNEYLSRIKRVQSGAEMPPAHNTHINIPDIPLSYTNFVF